MTEILEVLKDFSPFATIALALLIIFQLVMQRKTSKGVDRLGTNHLHEIKETLLRMEQNQNLCAGRLEGKLDKLIISTELIKEKLNN